MNVENVVRPPQKPKPMRYRSLSLKKPSSVAYIRQPRTKLPVIFTNKVPQAPGRDNKRDSLNAEPKNQATVLGLNASYLSIANGIGPVIAGIIVKQSQPITYSYPLYFQSQNQKARPLYSPHDSKAFSTSFAVTGWSSCHSCETSFSAHESIGMKSERPRMSRRLAAA